MEISIDYPYAGKYFFLKFRWAFGSILWFSFITRTRAKF
jgi:hypothetical protein